MPADTELRDHVPQAQTEVPGDRPAAASRSSRRRDAAIVVVALLVGMGAVAGYGAVTGPDETAATATIDADVSTDPVPLAGADADVAPGAPAASPTEAVDRFLTAEAAGDFTTSYALLTTPQRSQYGSAASWTSAHADFLPVTGHEILEAGDDRVVAEVEYRSGLDEVVGLVPARARVQWVVGQEDGGWLVDFDAAVLEPILPDEAGATTAAAEWVQSHQDCTDPDQYEGALVATGDLVRAAESLCETSARITTGDAAPLDEFDASAFVSAFGTEALSWARAVVVRGPVELTVVLAPVEDRWLVVGLLPST